MMMRAWEISQAYEAVQGVCRFCATRLDCHKNSDLGSEVCTVTGLNSTTLHLIESVALLTKSIGIVTPLILSIIVVVALRLISYKKELPDHIVQVRAFRLYHTWASGYGGKRKKETMQSDVSVCLGEVQPKRNRTTRHLPRKLVLPTPSQMRIRSVKD